MPSVVCSLPSHSVHVTEVDEGVSYFVSFLVYIYSSCSFSSPMTLVCLTRQLHKSESSQARVPERLEPLLIPPPVKGYSGKHSLSFPFPSSSRLPAKTASHTNESTMLFGTITKGSFCSPSLSSNPYFFIHLSRSVCCSVDLYLFVYLVD